MNKVRNILCCCALLLAAGCKDSLQEYDPNIKFARTGDVTLVASIENCSTKASLVGTGEARWQNDDAISVVCTDGSSVEFALDGTGETRRAFFSGTIPEGKRMGDYAFYPSSVTLDGNILKAVLPGELTPQSTGSCSVMVAPIGDSYEIGFRQLMSYFSVQIAEVSSEATTIELKSDRKLSGEVSVTFGDALETGIPAVEGSEGLLIVLPEKHGSTVNVFFPVPVGEYGSLVAVQYDGSGRNIGEVECLDAPARAELAAIRSISATLPKYSPLEPIEGTVLVAGIYWALGNLQHFEGSTDEGFRTDWRIAPNQWEYVNCENAGASGQAVTFKATDYTQCDHFNWGGIASPFDNELSSIAIVPVGTDIAGKMYTSQDCAAETADFSEARYGDLAYWASNGRYRMPTVEEFTVLLNQASARYGSYRLAEGKVVTGFLFTDPAPGELPVFDDNEAEFSEEDIAGGLFLPKAGRRYNVQPLTVNVQGTQGEYWAAEAITGDAAAEGLSYGSVFAINSAKITYPYWNKAFDSRAGFCIRPVYVAK